MSFTRVLTPTAIWREKDVIVLTSNTVGVRPRKIAPVEEAIAKAFLPALLQEQNKLPKHIRGHFTLPGRPAEIGIPIPCSTARDFFETSANSTKLLAQSLVPRWSNLDHVAHGEL